MNIIDQISMGIDTANKLVGCEVIDINSRATKIVEKSVEKNLSKEVLFQMTDLIDALEECRDSLKGKDSKECIEMGLFRHQPTVECYLEKILDLTYECGGYDAV